jgi:hypothetical protein
VSDRSILLFPVSSLGYQPHAEPALADRITDKLADALFLLDDVLDLLVTESSLRLDRLTRSPIERAYNEINNVMKQLTD